MAGDDEWTFAPAPDLAGWARTRRALRLYRGGLFISALVTIYGFCCCGALSSGMISSDAGMIAATISLVLQLIGPILTFTGLVLAIWPPEEVGRKDFARGALIVAVVLVTILVTLVGLVLLERRLMLFRLVGECGYWPIIQIVAPTMATVTLALFIHCWHLHLSMLLRHLGSMDLVHDLSVYRWAFSVWTGCVLLAVVGLFQPERIAETGAVVLLVLCVMGVPILYIWELALVHSVETVIDEAMGKFKG